jgi:hypothetical protein
MQVSARALFSYGMELVPGCDKVDPGAANGTMGYRHGYQKHRDQLDYTAGGKRREISHYERRHRLKMTVRYCRIRKNVLFAPSQPL